VALAVTLLPTLAEDWTVNGKTYHNVTVSKVEPDSVHIMFDGGIGSLKLSDLTPELQKRFNYDPAKAKAAEEAEAERHAQLERKDAAAKRVVLMQKLARKFPVEIKQVLADGLLCEEQSIVSVSSFNVASYEGTGKLIFVQASPEGMAEGNMISVNAFQDGVYKYTDTQGASRTVEKWVGSVKPID
jgi:hypothetical protein